jgi:hypothetical protein
LAYVPASEGIFGGILREQLGECSRNNQGIDRGNIFRNIQGTARE